MIGRYHRVRGEEIWRGTYTPPMILDRGRAQDEPRLLPFPCEEWWKSPSGVWTQVRAILANERGTAGYQGATGSFQPFLGFPENDGSLSNSLENLSSAYTAGSAGNCGGAWGMLPYAKTLKSIYFPIASYGGTAANVTSINWNVRANAASNLPDNTGTLAAGTVNPNSKTGYIKANSSDINLSISAMTYYHSIVADADGNSTDFARLVTAITSTYDGFAFWYRNWQSQFSSNGFGGRTMEGLPSSTIWVFSDQTAFGNPFSTTALPTSDTNQKGVYSAGFLVDKIVWALISDVVPAGITGCKLWEGATGPSGTAKDDSTILRYSTTNIIGACFNSPQTMTASTAYRLVLKGTSSFQAPRQRQCGTVDTSINSGLQADISPAMPYNGNMYFTKESSGSWADTTTALPHLTIYFVDDVAANASITFVQTSGGGMVGSYYA